MQNSRPTRVRWMIIFLAFLGTAINYIDRANLSVAAGEIRKELFLSQSQVGFILSAFFWTYAFCQLPAGWLVDRIGVRRMYPFACIWWSIFTALTALCRGFNSLLTCRLFLGIGEAGAYPANAKATAEWFPKHERGLASALFDSGSRVGTALSLPIVSFIIISYGWRASFVVTGALGIIWAVVWYSFYRRPSEHKWANEAEVNYIGQGGGREVSQSDAVKAQRALKWSDLFKYRTVIGMALGFFCLTFVNYFFITWFPTYLVEARGFTKEQLGTYGMIPPFVAVFGGWLGGYISDFLIRKGLPLTTARKGPILFGMCGSSAIGLAAIAPSAGWAIFWLAVSYASLSFAAASIWALPGDVAPTPAHVGSIGGIQNCASNIAGIVLPTMVGIILDRTNNNFVIPLVIAGVVGLVGAGIYAFVVGQIQPLPIESKKNA